MSNLATTADAIIKAVIAVLTLIAVGLVVVGLTRAWRGRRKAQVVIEDIALIEGMPSFSMSGLSPQLRQAVRQALLQESRDASYAVLNTLEQDINNGLLRTHGQIRVGAIAAGLRSTVQDSLTTLAAGVRAVAPKEAEGLVAALGAALPAQRGWVVRVFPVLRDTGSDAGAAVTVELAQLGHPPDAVTTFWISSDELRTASVDADKMAAARTLLYRLLDPAALWVAIRLVSRQLAQSGVPTRWKLLAGRKLDQELAGLQMQLAGQMSLYATQKQNEFDRGFAGQALADLENSAQLLSGYYRPCATEAAVHERLGWSYHRDGNPAEAAKEFTRAIRCHDKAVQMLMATSKATPTERDAALERIRMRRTKCRLLSGDCAYQIVARRELSELCQMTGTTSLALYNAACLFAVAMSSQGIPPDEQSCYQQHAWQLLGRALLAGGEESPWSLVMTDPELESMDARQRRLFCDQLKTRHPALTPLASELALPIVQDAMGAIGMGSPEHE